MSCAGFSSNAFTKEELDRWTSSIYQLLASSRGRECFKLFLETRLFEEARLTVEFWEDVDELQNQLINISESDLTKKLKRIYLNADEHINFDASQMTQLKNVQGNEKTMLKEFLIRVKEWTVNLLTEEYRSFSVASLKDLQRRSP